MSDQAVDDLLFQKLLLHSTEQQMMRVPAQRLTASVWQKVQDAAAGDAEARTFLKEYMPALIAWLTEGADGP
jgi:hypothetical protein